ncbi:MAG: hypothetical protein LBV04_10455 [Deferribacteraceae bacterium]|jgi:tetratricopeptide (TPR) repeat protein|nr:hypothetical protein [Deferribacteraceae bacterium]
MEYDNALKCIHSYNGLLSLRLNLLKEYLIAIAIYKSGKTFQLHKEALISLKIAAEKAKSVELGFWCDCLSTLISFYVNLGQIHDASMLEKELIYYYSEKRDMDFATIGINILHRKSAAVNSVERAIMRTKESVIFFRNTIYSSQYLMALNNHSANLLVLGKYDDAKRYLMEAFEFIGKHPTSSIIKIYLLNNYFVYQIQKTSEDYSFPNNLLDIINCYEDYGWSIIPLINSAIYYALNNDLNTASILLERASLLNNELNDSYFSYYINANLAAINYLCGDRDHAIQILIDNCLTVPALTKATESYYLKKRTTLWIEIMKTTNITDPKLFHNFFIDDTGGNQWKFICHGFLCSDLQFWSEF